MFIIPDAFKHMEDQLNLRSYISNPITGYIASTIEFNNFIADMLRQNPVKICAPFTSWEITRNGDIRFSLNKPINDNLGNVWNRTPTKEAMKEINSHNRGWHETKPYPRYLELSQPKEKDDETNY